MSVTLQEQLEIRSDTEDSYMLLSCYVNPDLDENSFNSCIAIDHPYAIEYEAASKIFKMIGWDEQAAAMKQEVVEQFTLLRNNNLFGLGY